MLLVGGHTSSRGVRCCEAAAARFRAAGRWTAAHTVAASVSGGLLAVAETEAEAVTEAVTEAVAEAAGVRCCSRSPGEPAPRTAPAADIVWAEGPDRDRTGGWCRCRELRPRNLFFKPGWF